MAQDRGGVNVFAGGGEEHYAAAGRVGREGGGAGGGYGGSRGQGGKSIETFLA